MAASPIPIDLQRRLAAHQAESESGAVAPSPEELMARAMEPDKAPEPAPDPSNFMTAEGAVDFSVFAVGSAADAAPVATPSVAVVAESPAPLTSEQLGALQRQDPDLALRMLDTQQQVSGLREEIARLRAVSDQSNALAAKVAELEAANQQLRAQQQRAAALTDGIEAPELTEDDLALFQNPALLRAIERIAQKQSADMLRRHAEAAQQRLTAVEAQLREQQDHAAAAFKATQENALRAAVVQRHADVQQVFKDPAFAAFLQTKAPFSTDTLSQRLQAAWTSGAADVVSAIIDAYKQQRASAAPQPTAQPHVRTAPVAPPAAAAPTPFPQEKPMLSAAKYAQASAMYRAGQITVEQFAAIRKAYDEAAREGRVVNDRRS